MNSLNLGILAHVDAGKTSLTERLLYRAGVIDKIGSVDQGNTQTDSLVLERQRGITIKSAVVSFAINGIEINLIDTPGHPDFIAEVERVLGVLDGAILVISAVEGVQAQTRILMRTLQRLHIPTLIYVNKIDRPGARYETLLKEISEKLKIAIVPMGVTHGLGTPNAGFVPHDGTSLASEARQASAYPVFFGSAITGAGIDALTAGIAQFLPSSTGNIDTPISGTIFKVERNPKGEKVAYARLFSGTVHVRDRVHFAQGKDAKVTSISVFSQGSTIQRSSIVAGEIGKLWGLDEIQVGDTIGQPQSGKIRPHFAPPTIETVVVAKHPENKGVLHSALSQLAEQDPLINLRQDDARGELFVSLYGEVQKEVIESTLASDYGIGVTFRETTPIYIERPIGVGEAVELLQEETNPTSATLGLRIEPAPVGTGVQFQLGENPGRIPVYVYKTTDKFVESMAQHVSHAFQEGLFGWQVTDCLVMLTRSGYYAGDGPTKPISATTRTTAVDFRILTPLVLLSALERAGTAVCEPVHHFRLEIPEETYGAVISALAHVRAVPLTTEMNGSSYVIEGDIPAIQMSQFQRQLPALTSGEGVLECSFDRYEPVKGESPTRPRTNRNPLDRKEYLAALRGL